GPAGTWSLIPKPAPVLRKSQPILGDAPTALLPDGSVVVGNNNGAAIWVGGDLTQLVAPCDAEATVVQVLGFGSKFPHPAAPFLINVDHEVMRVTQVALDQSTWTVDRGQLGTPAVAHGIGAPVNLVSTLTAPADATSISISVASTAGFPDLNPTAL